MSEPNPCYSDMDDSETVEFSPGYFVTAKGNVFSIKRHGRWRGVRRLTTVAKEDGYLWIRYGVNGARVWCLVHKLVAIAFLPPRPSSAHVTRHLNGNPKDNRRENLAWGTTKENAADRDAHGRTARGSRAGNSKLTEDRAVEIKRLLAAGVSQNEIGRRFGLSGTWVGKIAIGKAWTHVRIPEPELPKEEGE